MKIVIFGHGDSVKMVVNLLQNGNIDIVNVEQDRIRSGEEQYDFVRFLEKRNIKINQFEELNQKQIDLIFVINYNRIIDIKQIKIKKIINLHIGLLPKYRGNNANAWAVINGEKKVGYTIHDVTEILDAGNIYYSFKYPIKEGETYFEAKNAINKDFQTSLEQVLTKINENRIESKSQDGEKYIYCSKIRVSDGIISDWNINTEIILRKHYVFSKPLGTGLKFEFKGKTFTIERVEKIKNFAKSKGIPGGVVYILNNTLWIKTKDTVVAFVEISLEGERINVKDYFKIGQRL